MTTQQIEFARKHGITQCPPGPVFRVVWSAEFDSRISEDERIAIFSLGDVPLDWKEAARLFHRGPTGNRIGRHAGKNGR